MDFGDDVFSGDVLVVGLPKDVPEEKVAALTKVSNHRFRDFAKKSGLEFSESKTPLQIPTNGTFGIITTANAAEADRLAQNFHKLPLDKNHTLHSIPLNKALKAVTIPQEQEIQAELKALKFRNIEDVKGFDRTDLRDWLKDEGQREMYLIRANKDLHVCFFEAATNEPILQSDGEQARAEKRTRMEGTGEGAAAVEPSWTHGEASWSPLGSYLCTQHAQGYRLWGGSNFRSAVRLAHRNVAEILFSPDEEYVVTWNGSTDPSTHFAICVHLVCTGDVLKTLPPPQAGPNGDGRWPLLAWSHNSKYLATATGKKIVIFELPNMTERVLSDAAYTDAQFAWQPNRRVEDPAIMAVWSPAQNADSPCRLTILQVPSLKVLTSKNLFSENGRGKIYWQPEGDYVALVSRVTRRLQGKKRVLQTQVEIIGMRDRSLPVESITSTEDILNVFWSPSRDRFALLSANHEFRFYTLNQRGCEEAGKLDVPREINCLRWSPLGSHLVMGSVASVDGSGNLLFAQCIEHEAQKTYQVDIIHKDEVAKLTDVSWDPSGRFVLTCVTTPVGSDTGYRTAGVTCYAIWSFQGRALYREGRENMHSVAWRPHPPSVLTEKKREDIRQHMKEYSKKLDAIDNAKRMQRKYELQQKRDAIANEFRSHIMAVQQWYIQHPLYQDWEEAQAAFDASRPTEEIVVEREEIISVVTKPTGIGARV